MSIKILKERNPEVCTGCGACDNVCGKRAITMAADTNGFLYPQVTNDCVECGACERVCPQLNDSVIRKLNRASQGFLAVGLNSNLIQLSASGGAFATFAQYVIEKQNGVVFGAVMGDDFIVRHCCAETLAALMLMLGSKYVQSDMGFVFQNCRRFLEEGRKVLFSGTPCQIAGLYGFLGKHYENLITVDIVCHGVSAPGAFQQYIDWISKKANRRATAYRFRNKTRYDRAGFISQTVFQDGKGKSKVVYCKAELDVYYKAYLDGKLFRESCYYCPYAQEKRIGDITIGDCNSNRRYQDFHPFEGVSIILLNSEIGGQFWKDVSNGFDCIPLDVAVEMAANGQLHQPSVRPENCDEVRRDFALGRFDKYEEELWRQTTPYKKIRIWAQLHIPRKLRMKICKGVRWFKSRVKYGK